VEFCCKLQKRRSGRFADRSGVLICFIFCPSQTKFSVTGTQSVTEVCNSKNTLQWIDINSSIQSLYLFTILFYVRLAVLIVGIVFLLLVAKELRDSADLYTYAKHTLKRKEVDISGASSMDDLHGLKLRSIHVDSTEYHTRGGNVFKPIRRAGACIQYFAPKLLYGRAEPSSTTTVSDLLARPRNDDIREADNHNEDTSALRAPENNTEHYEDDEYDASSLQNKSTLRHRLLSSIQRKLDDKTGGKQTESVPQHMSSGQPFYAIGDGKKRASSLFQEHRLGHSSAHSVNDVTAVINGAVNIFEKPKSHESKVKDREDTSVFVKIRLLDGWRLFTALGCCLAIGTSISSLCFQNHGNEYSEANSITLGVAISFFLISTVGELVYICTDLVNSVPNCRIHAVQ
jgi:hypothetical protein